jgi:hypothetical protein
MTPEQRHPLSSEIRASGKTQLAGDSDAPRIVPQANDDRSYITFLPSFSFLLICRMKLNRCDRDVRFLQFFLS